MFGISLPELAIVFIIILVFFGPDKLPEAAKKLGKLMSELKRGSDAVRREFYNYVYAPVNEIKAEVRRELTTAQNMAKEMVTANVVDDHDEKDYKSAPCPEDSMKNLKDLKES